MDYVPFEARAQYVVADLTSLQRRWQIEQTVS